MNAVSTPRLALLLLGSLAALGVARTASATPEIVLTFTATTGAGAVGSDTIGAAPGDRVTLTVSVIDPAGPTRISGYWISLEFDLNLQDELDLFMTDEFLPPGMAANLVPGVTEIESVPGSAGQVLGYDAFNGMAPAGVDTPFAVGTVTFTVTGNVAASGQDIVSFFDMNPGMVGGTDGIPDPIEPVFRGATVNPIPEPGTASLIALGLLGLGSARRRPTP